MVGKPRYGVFEELSVLSLQLFCKSNYFKLKI